MKQYTIKRLYFFLDLKLEDLLHLQPFQVIHSNNREHF